MEFLANIVMLSQLQFAITVIFHIFWMILTTGMRDDN